MREGVSLDAAVVDAGAVRFPPMFKTAMAVIVGGAIILFDPIFQGLAISLMAGEIASLLGGNCWGATAPWKNLSGMKK